MKRFLTILFAMVVAVGGVYAQEGKCPTLSISGPAGIPKPGEGMGFKAGVKGFDGTPGYSWTASGGEIVEGQGTGSIKVTFDEYKSVTVTLRVTGFPEGCPNSASEMVAILRTPVASILKEESGPALKSIGDAVAALKDNLDSMIWVVIEVEDKDSIEPMKARTRDLWKGLSEYEKPRIRFVVRSSHRDHTTFYLVPPGATPPACATDEICISHPE